MIQNQREELVFIVESPREEKWRNNVSRKIDKLGWGLETVENLTPIIGSVTINSWEAMRALATV